MKTLSVISHSPGRWRRRGMRRRSGLVIFGTASAILSRPSRAVVTLPGVIPVHPCGLAVTAALHAATPVAESGHQKGHWYAWFQRRGSGPFPPRPARGEPSGRWLLLPRALRVAAGKCWPAGRSSRNPMFTVADKVRQGTAPRWVVYE